LDGSLAGRRIVLGVCGGIAAYKAVEVCRRLIDAGAHVVPVLTEGATRFVGTVTFSALASEPAQTELFGAADPIPHTRLGQSADLVLVAPATARVIGCYAHGISNDLLTNTLLATRAPVLLAPAMHTEMWEHPSVRDNIALLSRRGVHLVGPDVTAGGTREPIDPVRFVGNRSSGKQGYAIADEAAARGARVVLVTTVERPVAPKVEVIRVATAAEMEAAVLARAADADVVVMAAAVADFRPKAVAPEKIKKDEGLPEIVLEPTPDILAALGRAKRPGQTLVGFAAETTDVAANAAGKLRRKGLDLIVANDVSAPQAGFEHDTNHVVVLDADGVATDVPLMDKRGVARAVLDAVLARRGTTRHDDERGTRRA
jgi:phosphopantothenoylcysteine decarboxylase/phosphopantothenate--cysteine ligase